jgi:hypothetical protein
MSNPSSHSAAAKTASSEDGKATTASAEAGDGGLRSSLKSATSLLSQLAKTRTGKVDFEAFAECLIDEWGGMKSLAACVKSDYEQSPMGSMARSSIANHVMEIVCKASAKATQTDPFKDVSTEDLERAISAAANGIHSS